jgi:VWFA-related protein
VYDALILALLHQPAAGRRHLVVAFTDGEDGGSVLDSRTIVDVANRVEAVAHVVLVQSRNDDAAGRPPIWVATGVDIRGLDRLSEAAERTGGAVYRSTGRLVTAFETVLGDFRASYLLQYTPSGVTKDGWHEIAVGVTRSETVSVRARRGYFGG